MPALKLQKKRALIVEDQAEMRIQLKSMLELLELGIIDTATTGEEALQALRNRNYDIVFVDYELGRGKDGQQVLEEARHFKLIKETSAFLMVTAAQTVEMVMGALEYHPDGYIAKPVTYDNLAARIQRILKTKQVFEQINSALDDEQPELALEKSNQLLLAKPRLALPIYRIQGKIYLSLDNITKAEAVYREALNTREVDWAKLGLGKVFYHRKQYDPCIELLEALPKTNKRHVEALDWLAKAYEAKGELKKSQRSLERATEESPKAILRQIELARIAKLNNDWKVVTRASRKIVSLGKNSCYKKPENYINLVEALQTQLQTNGLRERRYLTVEIARTLQAIKNEYPDTPELIITSHLLDAQTQTKLGNKNQAKQNIDQTLELITETSDDLPEHLILKTCFTLVDMGEEEKLKTFLASKACTDHLSEEAIASVNAHATRAEEGRVQARIDELNNRGVEFFEKGDLQKAIEIFDEATAHDTVSHSVLLNCIQAHVALLQEGDFIQESLDKCEAMFEKLSHMDKTDKRYARFESLQSLYMETTREA